MGTSSSSGSTACITARCCCCRGMTGTAMPRHRSCGRTAGSTCRSAAALLDLLLDLRSSTDIGIFWVLPFCKQLYAEWGIQQPDVNCEYLTTALQVVCGTERKLAVRKEILQTVAEEHHTTVAAVDCGMRRLIDGVEKYNTEAWQKFKQDYGLMGHSVTLGKLIYAGRQKLIDSGTQGRKAGR